MPRNKIADFSHVQVLVLFWGLPKLLATAQAEYPETFPSSSETEKLDLHNLTCGTRMTIEWRNARARELTSRWEPYFPGQEFVVRVAYLWMGLPDDEIAMRAISAEVIMIGRAPDDTKFGWRYVNENFVDNPEELNKTKKWLRLR